MEPSSLATTQSSGKSIRSSSRKRRRRAAPSKLWTSGVDLDLSDSDSDDDVVRGKVASSPSTDPDERAEAAPRIKKSLFRPEALQLFDDLLSSSSDDHEG
jgi:hypothetical protein